MSELLTLDQAAADLTVSRRTVDRLRVSRRKLERERLEERALRALIETGSYEKAAKALNYSAAHLRRVIRGYCDRHGYESDVQAAYYFGRPEFEAHFEHLHAR